MRTNYICLLFLIILVLTDTFTCAGQIYPPGHGEAIFNVCISSDVKNATIGQPIDILFNLSNPACEDLESTTLNLQLNESIEPPNTALAIEYYDKKTKNDNFGHNLSIEHDNNGNRQITIDNKGNVKIQFKIAGNEYILINYETYLAEKGAIGTNNIATRPTFNFAEHSQNNNISIGTIEKEKTKIKKKLIIEIYPNYNISYEDKIFYIFEGTTIRFPAIENIKVYDNFNQVNDEDINDYIYTYPPRDHLFSAIIEDQNNITFMNNSTVFRTRNLIDYHRSLALSKGIWLSGLAAILFFIAFGLHHLFGKNNVIIILVFLGLIAVLYSGFFYDYLLYKQTYKDIILLGCISLFAGLYLLLHIYYNNMIDESKMAIQAVAMVLIVIWYNYNLPYILSNASISFILLFVPLGITIIIESILNKTNKCLNRLQSIIAILMIDIGIFSAAIVPILKSGIPFSSKFEQNYLVVIFLLEIVPIIVIAIAGIRTELVFQFIGVKPKTPNSSENSDGENKAK